MFCPKCNKELEEIMPEEQGHFETYYLCSYCRELYTEYEMEQIEKNNEHH